MTTAEMTEAERGDRVGDLMLSLEARAAALMEAGRYVDSAEIGAAKAYLEDYIEELNGTAPVLAPVPAPAPAAKSSTGHRHKYGPLGRCTLAEPDGSGICSAVSREAKKAAAAPAPAAPAAERAVREGGAS